MHSPLGASRDSRREGEGPTCPVSSSWEVGAPQSWFQALGLIFRLWCRTQSSIASSVTLRPCGTPPWSRVFIQLPGTCLEVEPKEPMVMTQALHPPWQPALINPIPVLDADLGLDF